VSLTLLALLLLIWLWRSWCSWCPRCCWRSCCCWHSCFCAHFYLADPGVLRSSNSVCKHARYSSVLYSAKYHSIPGNSAELKSLPHKILSSAECQNVTSVDTLLCTAYFRELILHTLTYTVPLPFRRPPLNFVGRQPDTNRVIYW
jgi:hypothetical protein